VTLLDSLSYSSLILVPGGGSMADVVRRMDRTHGLGNVVSHDLALRAVSLNAHFLTAIVQGAVVTTDCHLMSQPGRWVVDGHAFVDALPPSWEATSDSLAAVIAARVQAEELILLKSVDIPADMDWNEMAKRGWVDRLFPSLVPDCPVRAIQLRSRNLS